MLDMDEQLLGGDTQLGGPNVSLYVGLTLLSCGWTAAGFTVGIAAMGESDRLDIVSGVTRSFPGMYIGVKL